MGKRAIVAAAKKRGITIVSADYCWTATPGEMVPQWEIRFGSELDDQTEFFGNSAEAIEFIETTELLDQPPASSGQGVDP